jgi:hypothetical protein
VRLRLRNRCNSHRVETIERSAVRLLMAPLALSARRI